MYSERWPQRLAVFSLILLAGLIFALKRIEGALPIAILVWANHERFFHSMSERLRRRPWLVFAPALIAMGARVGWPAPAAHDDLLRHIVASFWPAGYPDMYVHASLPPNELYPSFDGILGMVAHQIGPLSTMWFVQAVAWASFVAVFVAAAFRLMPKSDDRNFWILALLLLTVSTVAIRLSLGRPEVFMAIWSLAALLPATRVGVALWVFAGLVLGSGYWLAPVYFPAALLLPIGIRSRVLVVIAMGTCWVAVWYAITGANPLDAIAWLMGALQARAEDISVGENASVINLVSLPGFVALLGGAAWAVSRSNGDLRLLGLAGYFLLSDQARYVIPASPLIALYVLSAISQCRVALTPPIRVGVLAGSILLAPAAVSSVPRLHEMPAFRLPHGSVVLTGFDLATYAIPFYNPGNVRVAPAFEVGAADLWLQALIGRMARGEFDCAALQGRGFTHVVEKSLKAPVPGCLQLLAVNGDWRLWRVSD